MDKLSYKVLLLQKSITNVEWRLRILVVLGCSILTLLCARSIFTMIVMGSSLRERADTNRTFTRPLLPPRGVIFDRNHTPLVVNVPTYEKIEGDETAVHPIVSPVDEHTAFSLLLHNPEKLVQLEERSYLFGPALSHVLGYVGFTPPSQN